MNSVKLEPTFFLPENRKNYSCKGKENKREITAIIEQKWNKVEDEDFDLGIIILYKIPQMLYIYFTFISLIQ